jgi:hypothetical protein
MTKRQTFSFLTVGLFALLFIGFCAPRGAEAAGEFAPKDLGRTDPRDAYHALERAGNVRAFNDASAIPASALLQQGVRVERCGARCEGGNVTSLALRGGGRPLGEHELVFVTADGRIIAVVRCVNPVRINMPRDECCCPENGAPVITTRPNGTTFFYPDGGVR